MLETEIVATDCSGSLSLAFPHISWPEASLLSVTSIREDVEYKLRSTMTATAGLLPVTERQWHLSVYGEEGSFNLRAIDSIDSLPFKFRHLPDG